MKPATPRRPRPTTHIPMTVPDAKDTVRASWRLVWAAWVVRTAERVAVTSGGGAGEWIEVRGGIRAGDRIVVRGNERLQPGMAVVGTPRQYAEP